MHRNQWRLPAGLAAGICASLSLVTAGRAADEVDVKQLLERLERVEKQNLELQKTLQEQKQLLERQQQLPPLPITLPGSEEKAADGALGPVAPAISTQSIQQIVADYLKTKEEEKKQLEECKSDSSGGSDPCKSSSESRFTAGWRDNSFLLQSADKNFLLRFTGQIQGDNRSFLNPGDRVDIDTFLIRRARFGLEANMFQYYEFRFLPDFGQGQAVIQDAYMNIHYWDPFQVEAGKFKQPFSYEQLIQDRFVPTMERSMIDQIVPARDEGLMIHGQKAFGDMLEYGVSISNGEINGNTDTNDQKDLVGRVAVRPFNCDFFWPILHRLQFGISGSTGVEQEPISPATLKTPLTVPWFSFSSTVRADGKRNRWSPELVYFYGPFGFAAQYIRQEQEMRPSFTGTTSQFFVDVPFDGYYLLATLLLTGEQRTAYTFLQPLRPFDPRCPFHCPGAWELVGRMSRLELGNQVFAPGPTRLADPTLFSRGATETTIGFNWYLNGWVRMQFNWEHAWFDSPVRLGPPPGGLFKESNALGTRLQIIF